jgi:sugar fermentation stimulation protein A
VTARGAKHLDELAGMVAAGARAILLFVIQIGSTARFSLARDIDPAYAAAFDRARAHGVEALAWRCRLSEHAIEIAAPVPIVEAADACARAGLAYIPRGAAAVRPRGRGDARDRQ